MDTLAVNTRKCLLRPRAGDHDAAQLIEVPTILVLVALGGGMLSTRFGKRGPLCPDGGARAEPGPGV